MYVYIDVVDVVANAFIGIINQGKNVILYKDLDAYGARVVEILNKHDNTTAVYISSGESNRVIFEDYSDFFDEYEDENKYKGIKLNDGITQQMLWSRFCVSLSLKILDAFMEANEGIAI